jgi:hypothetical protein
LSPDVDQNALGTSTTLRLGGAMRTWTWAVLAGALVLGTACDSLHRFGADSVPAYAVAARSCAPTDGPAVAIYLTHEPVTSLEPTVPYFQVAIWQPLEEVSGRTWTVAGDLLEGSASYRPSSDRYEFATTGRIRIDAVSHENTVRGSVDLRFPTAGRVRGGFQATWLTTSMMCG